jgi:hypothetical protein
MATGAEEEQQALWQRLALTLTLPFVLLLAWKPAPGLGTIDESLRGARQLSLLALGLTPVVWGYVVVELLALAVPKWRGLRHDWPGGRAKLSRAALCLSGVFAGLQALAIFQMLRTAPFDLSGGAAFVVVAAMVGGTALTTLVAHFITQQGLVNGIVLLTLVPALGLIGPNLTGSLEPVRASGAALALTLASFALMTWPRTEASAQVPLPASTIYARHIAVGLVFLPATLATFEVPKAEWLESHREYLELAQQVLPLATLVVGGALAFLLNRAAPRRALLRALVPTGLFLIVMAYTGAVVGEESEIVIPLLVAVLLDAALTLRCLDTVCVWEERRPHLLPAIQAILKSNGIGSRVLDANQSALYRIFGPFVATRVCVEREDATRAKALIHELLSQNSAAPEATSGQPEPSGSGAGLRNSLLAACALAAVWCSLPTEPLAAPMETARMTLEVLPVDDSVDPFAGAGSLTLPNGVSLNQSARNGVPWARLVPGAGESFDEAIERVRPWALGLALPAGRRIAWEKYQVSAPREGDAPEYALRSYVVVTTAVLTNRDIARASAGGEAEGEGYVAVTLTESGAQDFEAYTRDHVRARLAIVLDGQVLSAPVIQSVIPGGELRISTGEGDFAEAARLARAIAP